MRISVPTTALLLCAALLVSCAIRPDDAGSRTSATSVGGTGIRIVHRTPGQFCRGTARSIAVERYMMKRDGTPLDKALESNAGVAVVDTITRAIYESDLASEEQAADAGTSTCLRYFRRR